MKLKLVRWTRTKGEIKKKKRELVYNAKHLELALLRVGWWSRWVLLS
jgi:hypothetical protein